MFDALLFRQIIAERYFCFLVYNIAIFDIKGREPPQRYVHYRYFAKEVPEFKMSDRTLNTFTLYAHRKFEIDEYRFLFSFILDHSRDFVLDCEPTPYSIRYLT